MHVELRDEAREDLAVGAWFYDRQSAGLGDYFIDCLESDLKDLESTSGIHEIAHGFQRKLSKKFPFAIYYLVADKTVDVVAILDCRENPDSTTERLGRTIT
jgi:hypothetical protein